MTKDKGYTGIDGFRLLAALLVAAIHTSPLASFSETGDFILTRVAARVAVPFFFMTSGFFLISRYSCHAKRLAVFIKKTAVIYGAAILIFLPLNQYNGYFKMDCFLPNLLKDLVFDGTFYHLWYLPASMLGAAIAWYLVKRLGYKRTFAIVSVLYLIGLFGDSYYGIAQKSACLRGFYGLLFQVSDYTRNGIFFAPVFFVLGGFIADNRRRLAFGKSICGFGLSFGLMLGEALALRHFQLQRHDCMYVFLLPCMFFLFHAILHFKGTCLAGVRTVSLMIYLIHPMIIVIIRLFAKLLHLQEILVENSLVHYSLVCLTSLTFSVAAAVLWEKCGRKRKKHNADTDRAYIEIDLGNLEHNVKVLRRAMPPKCKLMAVVKAEAYGHGMYEIASCVNKMGVDAFAVATIEEGIRLRRYGILGEILILGYTAPARAKELRRYDLTQTLIDYNYSLLLNRQGCGVKAHIKVDTGMHRLGFDKEEPEKIASVFSMKHIKVCGIYTHLCASDALDENSVRFTKMQLEAFYRALDFLKKKGITIPKVHIQSSYGLLNYPELTCGYVRTGVALYGVLSSPKDKTKLNLDLRPVLSLKASVVLLRTVRKGESVGYSRAFIAGRDSRIAILSVGYADGVPRKLSCQRGCVLIKGQRAPIVGKICMDQLAVDVTDILGVKAGMTATLIGKDGEEEILAAEEAECAESITNELLSRMGQRLKVTTVNKKTEY